MGNSLGMASGIASENSPRCARNDSVLGTLRGAQGRGNPKGCRAVQGYLSLGKTYR